MPNYYRRSLDLTVKEVKELYSMGIKSVLLFVKAKDETLVNGAFERRLFVLRNHTSHAIAKDVKGSNKEFYITSFSSKTIIYKGQLRTEQLRAYFDDLQDPRLKTALALVHSRFSTNTFPNWKLAQPFRYIAHNEIKGSTVQVNTVYR